jgi:uncharacterized protein with ATP-grasp and redox domains
MRTSLDCIPCLIRQALEATRLVSDDPVVQARVMRDVLAALADEPSSDRSPPEIAQRLHRHVRRLTDVDDPYAALKKASNDAALAALPRLRSLVTAAPDPFATAVRLTIAANTLDAGMNASDLPGAEADAARVADVDALVAKLRRSLEQPLHGDLEAFRLALAEARRIVYLTDNCGEIVVDRLLIEQLPRERLTIAVRGAPVLNDATRADAHVAGLDDLASVIDNGSNAPGTLPDDCSESFRRALRGADVVIAKGQGNYESLSDAPGRFFFLFKVKCAVIARHSGLPLHAHALLDSSA